MSNKKSLIDQTILRLYRYNREIVNDDRLLIEGVWLELGYNEDRSLGDNMSRLPPPESITRRRRLLHVQGKIKYSKVADKKRFKMFKEMQIEYSPITAKKFVGRLFSGRAK